MGGNNGHPDFLGVTPADSGWDVDGKIPSKISAGVVGSCVHKQHL